MAVVASVCGRRRELLPSRDRRRKPRVAVGGWGLERWGWVGTGEVRMGIGLGSCGRVLVGGRYVRNIHVFFYFNGGVSVISLA